MQCICTKARKTMGTLYQQFSSNVDNLAMKRPYTSLVRPHLEYGVEVWNPYLHKDIAALENVQKFALRVCFKKWSLNYQDLLELYVSSTISSPRPPIVPFSDDTLVYDIVYFPPDLLPPFISPSGLRSNISGNKFKIPFARTNQ